jgi:hypothetical protein
MAQGDRYGPHRPEDAPDRPHALTRQRVAINTVAHHGRLSRGICRVCGRDEWDCLSVRPGPDAHEFEPSR